MKENKKSLIIGGIVAGVVLVVVITLLSVKAFSKPNRVTTNDESIGGRAVSSDKIDNLTYLEKSAGVIDTMNTKLNTYTRGMRDKKSYYEMQELGKDLKNVLDDFAKLKPSKDFEKIHYDFVDTGIKDMKTFVDTIEPSYDGTRSALVRKDAALDAGKYLESYGENFNIYMDKLQDIAREQGAQ